MDGQALWNYVNVDEQTELQIGILQHCGVTLAFDGAAREIVAKGPLVDRPSHEVVELGRIGLDTVTSGLEHRKAAYQFVSAIGRVRYGLPSGA